MPVSIPKQLFDTLQTAFQTEARRLCRDAAKVLKQPEKDVLQILQKLPKLTLQIVDDSDLPLTCPILLQQEGILARCRAPCLLGTGRCLTHQDRMNPPEVPETGQTITKLLVRSESEGSFWTHEETNLVLDATGHVVGRLTDEKELILYECESPSAEGR